MDVRPRETYWPQDLPTVTVIGAGSMGRDIAATALFFGHETRLYDVDEEAVRKAADHVERRLKDLDRKGLLYGDVQAFTEGLSTFTDLEEAAAGAGIIVEAVPEDLELKQETFTQLAAANDDAVLATNTSGLSIGDIAEGTDAGERIVGTHFFNPVQTMPLCEVIPGPDTSQETLETAVTFARGLGKEVVTLQKDAPGFVTTRVLNSLLTTAARTVADGEVEPSAVDAGFRALGFPMGPFEVMDLTGLDVVAKVAGNLSDEVPKNLEELVAEEKLGRKTGEGWYTSEGPDREAEPADPWPLLVPALVEAGRIVDEGISTPMDVDRAMRLGASFPGGPFRLIAQEGLDEVVAIAEENDVDASVLEGIELPEDRAGLQVSTVSDITHIRFTEGHSGNRLSEATLEAFGSAVFDAPGPVIVSGEGRYFLHPKLDKFNQELLDPLRKRESLALIHGPLGEGAMSLARACRRRAARVDAAIGTDRPVPAVRAVQLDLVDTVAHPLELPAAIANVLSKKVPGVVESEVAELLYDQ